MQTSPISFVAPKEIGDVCTQANIKQVIIWEMQQVRVKEGLIATVETSYFLKKFRILRKEQTCIILHVQTERRCDSIRSRD